MEESATTKVNMLVAISRMIFVLLLLSWLGVMIYQVVQHLF